MKKIIIVNAVILVLIMFSTFLLLNAQSNTSETKSTAKVQYKIIDFNRFKNEFDKGIYANKTVEEKLEIVLNKMANQGWELHSILDPVENDRVIFIKR